VDASRPDGRLTASADRRAHDGRAGKTTAVECLEGAIRLLAERSVAARAAAVATGFERGLLPRPIPT